MEENLDRLLEKLDLILRLSRYCNSTLKRTESWGEGQHIRNVPSDDGKEPEAVDEAELEPEIVDELEPEIVDELEPDLEVVNESDLEPELEVSYWDPWRSFSGAYHGAIVVFTSFDGSLIPEAVTCTIRCRSF